MVQKQLVRNSFPDTITIRIVVKLFQWTEVTSLVESSRSLRNTYDCFNPRSVMSFNVEKSKFSIKKCNEKNGIYPFGFFSSFTREEVEKTLGSFRGPKEFPKSFLEYQYFWFKNS